MRGSSERLGVGRSWATHELRAALAGPRVALERVISRGLLTEQDLDLLRRSSQELDELADSVDAILGAAFGARPRRRPVDLVTVVREVAGLCMLEAGGDRIRIRAPESLEVLADPDQLRGAISNIVRNALAYSPNSSVVHIGVTGDFRWTRVSVRDRGPGITQAERDEVFRPFVRGSAGRAAREGSGLGLFIARRVVEAHAGSLSVSTDGSGTAFTIELPSRLAPSLPAATQSRAG